MKKYLINIFFLSLTNPLFSMPEPYRSITILPEDKEERWFADANATALDDAIKRINPSIVVEVGCWLGTSACFMAKRLKPNAKLYAVDHWIFGEKAVVETPALNQKLPTLYQQFLSNVIIRNLTDQIIPIRMFSIEAARCLDIKADLIYIDASHDEESVYNDIIAWWPKLSEKGEMYGDDYVCETVQKGVSKAADHLKLKIKVHNHNCWQLVN